MQHECHHCGYDLMGLPDQGHCPECGRYYDKHSSYRASKANEPIFADHIKWFSLLVFTVVVLMGGGTIALLSDRPPGKILLTLVIAGVSGLGAYAYWSAQRNERREAD